MQAAQHKYGFQNLAERQDYLSASLTAAAKFKNFDTMVIIGTGGSSIGTEALWKILTPKKTQKKLIVLDNFDFIDCHNKVDELDLTKTCWFLVSKSGSTLETLALTEWVSQSYRKKEISFYDKCVVCSENQLNPLTEWAQKNNILQLEVPIDVGGRFSVLSSVGLFPLAFGGVNISDLLTGAKEALNASDINSLAEKCIASFKTQTITVFWFYSSVAKPFGPWIQQLWAESLAKKFNIHGAPTTLQGSTPLFAIGSCDQHSILQQVAEGYEDKFLIFFRSHELENYSGKIEINEFKTLNYLNNKNLGMLITAAAEGTEESLKQAGKNTHRIYYPDHSEKSFGYLVMWFECLVAKIGEKLAIDPFNQPGVEASKKITKSILSK